MFALMPGLLDDMSVWTVDTYHVYVIAVFHIPLFKPKTKSYSFKKAKVWNRKRFALMHLIAFGNNAQFPC